MITMRILIISLAACIALSGLAFGAELTLSASADATSIARNEALHYQVTISGQSLDAVPDPELPDLKGAFQVGSRSQGSSFQMINGKTSVQKQFIWTLIPRTTGKVTIGASRLQYRGTTYMTQPIAVTISNRMAAAPANDPFRELMGARLSPPPTQSEAGPKPLIADVKIGPKEVFVGQRVLYQVNLCTRAQLWQDPQWVMPKFNNAIFEDLPFPNTPETRDFPTGRYMVIPLAKKAVYPLKPGGFLIEASPIRCVIDPFDGEQVLPVDGETLQVKPLPTPMPTQFSGLVGDFSVTLNVNTTRVAQGAPVTLFITISGDGYLKKLTDLSFSADDRFKRVRSRISDQVTGNQQLTNSRTFEYLMIPRLSGEIALPTTKLIWFSPTAHRFSTWESPAMRITVFPSGNMTATPSATVSSAPDDSDIRFLKPVTGFRKNDHVWVRPWFALLLVVSGLSLIGMLGHRFWLWTGSDHTALLRPARLRAQKALQQLAQLSPTETLLFSQLNTIMTIYLSQATGQSLHGTELETWLADLGKRLTPELCATLRDFLARVNEAAFSPRSVTDSLAPTLLFEAHQLILTVEKELRE